MIALVFSYEVRDAASDFPGRFDVITTFDVIHDAVDPVAVLRSIFRALKPDGIYVCLDANCSDKLEENTGPIGSIFHGISILYCMTTSLAGGGAGLGTLGLHEHKLRDLFGYNWALAAFEITVIIALGVVTWAGKEQKGKSFLITA